MSLNQAIEKIKIEISHNNHQLIIIIVNQTKKNSFIEHLKEFENIDILNLNFLLSQTLVSLPKNKFSDPVQIIENIISKNSSKHIILLSSINILFDKNLKWNPFEILKKLSRNKRIIVLWDGKFTTRGLEYASHPHLENIHYSIAELKEILIMETT